MVKEMIIKRKQSVYPILLAGLIALFILIFPGFVFANHTQDLRCTGVILRHPQCRLVAGDNMDVDASFNATGGDFDTCFAQVDFSKCVSAQWEEGQGSSDAGQGETGGLNKGEFEFIENNRQKIQVLDENGVDIGDYEVKSFGRNNSDSEAFEHRRSFYIFLNKPLKPDCIYQVYVGEGIQSRNGMSRTSESTVFTFKTKSEDSLDSQMMATGEDTSLKTEDQALDLEFSSHKDNLGQGRKKTLAQSVATSNSHHTYFVLLIVLGLGVALFLTVKNKRGANGSFGEKLDLQNGPDNLSKTEKTADTKDDKVEI